MNININNEKELRANAVRRFNCGDEAAFTELINMMEPKLKKYARTLVGDKSYSFDELYADTIYTIWQKLEMLRDENAVLTWSYSIMRFKALEMFRESKKELDRIAQIPNEGDEGSYETRFFRDDETAEQEIERREEIDKLRLCLDKLSAEKKMTFVLKYADDYSIKDIAEMMNVPEGTVKTRLMHARKELGEMMESF